MKGKKHFFILTLILVLIASMLSGCSGSINGNSKGSSVNKGSVTKLGNSSKKISILSGSDNSELEPILTEYAKKNHVEIDMTYKGSLDIMRALAEEDFNYDAVWPASSVWMNAGDEKLHRIKHAESISITPVIFGIKKSKAEELGFVGKDV